MGSQFVKNSFSSKQFETEDICLNCREQDLTDANYCPNCGQSTNTRRFSISVFFKRDFIQSIFTIDKGFFFSLRWLLKNPGKMVYQYINGKRARFLSFGSFYMVLLGFFIFFSYFNELQMIDVLNMEGNEETKEIFDFYEQSPKISNIVQIPVVAFFSWIFFWTDKINFSEHLVINVYRQSFELLFLLLHAILSLLTTSIFIQEIGYWVAMSFISFYTIWLYSGFFINYFKSKMQVVIISIFCYFISILLGGTILSLAVVYNPFKGYI